MTRFLSLILAFVLTAAMAPGLAAGGNVESFRYAMLEYDKEDGADINVKSLLIAFYDYDEVLAINLVDLTNVRLTKDGEELPVKLGKDIRRWVQPADLEKKYTYFSIPFDRIYTELGVYKLYATYQGVPIESAALSPRSLS